MPVVYHNSEVRLLEDNALEIRVRHPWPNTFRMASWNDGLGLFRASGRRWADATDALELAFFASAWRSPATSVLARFAATIPAEAVRLACIRGRYELNVLQLLRWHDAAWDLARTAPNLTYLLAACADDRRVPREDVAALVRCRRVEILSWCTGAPTTPAAVRFLEKLVIDELNESELTELTRKVNDAETVRLFRRFARVSPDTLYAVRNFGWATPPRDAAIFVDVLAREVGAGDDDADRFVGAAVGLYCDALRAATLLGIGEADARARLRRVRSVAALRVLHDAWSDAMNAAFRAGTAITQHDVAPGPFPAPPLADTADIVAIRDVHALREEGSEMRHCVAAYAPACARGECFFFRVLAPTRATLEVRMRGRTPFVRQLAGVRNADVPSETRGAVAAWLFAGRLRRDAQLGGAAGP